MTTTALRVLLDKLSDDISRADGDAAVRTLSMIRVVAGDEFTFDLIHRLINTAVYRQTGGTP